MAYNVLKGVVEFSNDTTGSIENMVDCWSDQLVWGVKNFSNTLSASIYWDTTNDVQITAPAITSISSDSNDRLLTSDGDGTVTAESGATFDGTSFNIVGNITGSTFSGSAIGLTNIPVSQFASAIPASSIDYGNGLTASSTTIVVNGGDGITVDGAGVAVDLGTSEGLSFLSGKLTLDPTNATDVTDGGQNLADADVILVEDVSHGLRKTTLTNLYTNYIAAKLPSDAVTALNNAVENRLTTIGATTTELDGEANLTFDGSKLTVLGNISGSGEITTPTLTVASSATFSGSLVVSGGVTKNIIKTNTNYSVLSTDYTVLMNTSASNLQVTLPSASLLTGRIINVKKVHSNNTLTISASSGLIDGANTEDVSNDNALRGVQSDGTDWWYVARHN